jgi:hypothetical protein
MDERLASVACVAESTEPMDDWSTYDPLYWMSWGASHQTCLDKFNAMLDVDSKHHTAENAIGLREDWLPLMLTCRAM